MYMDIIFTLFLIFLSSLLSYPFLKKYNKHESIAKPKLPPGSLGWPYIGETFQLYSQHPNIFFASKQKRFFIFSLIICKLIWVSLINYWMYVLT